MEVVDMNGQRRLGRGLEALLGEPLGSSDGSNDVTAGEAGTVGAEGFAPSEGGANGIVQLSVYEIDTNPFQPRREFDESEIDALAQSIRDHGLIQPIVVRPMNGR